MDNGYYEPGVFYLQDAKQAATSFVSLMQTDDQIGVVSFSNSGSVNYPLTTITSDAIINAAINAINGLTASGGTSIGAGMQLAQGQLNSRGRNESPWAIVLLSDGEENVDNFHKPHYSD